MKDKPWFAVVYMFVMTAFASSILIGFSRLTRSRVEANAQLQFERAVVQVFPDIRFQHDEQIHRIFTQQFEKDPRSGAFRFLKDGRLAGYAVPFSGQGFWDKIEGVIGVAADRRTITGIAFYRQNETPGLGARIEEEEFRSQFAGKRLAESPILLEIVPSAQPLGPNSVHAVTGATQTSDRLQILLNANLHTWLEAVSNEGEAQ